MNESVGGVEAKARPMDKKQPVDWELAERLYRAGQLSVREIARQAGCNEKAIRKRAMKDGWTRDLTHKVKVAVRTALVRSEVRTKAAGAKVSDQEAIRQAGETGAAVVRSHRTDISSAADTVRLLSAQLREAADNRQEIEDQIAAELDPQIEASKGPARQALYAKKARMLQAVSLPAHANVALSLSTALKNLVGLERQAWNLDDGRSSDTPYEEALRQLFDGQGGTGT